MSHLFTSFGIVLGFVALLIVGAAGFTAESFALAVIVVVVGMLLSLFLLDSLRISERSKARSSWSRKLRKHMANNRWRWGLGLSAAATAVALAANLSQGPAATQPQAPLLALAALPAAPAAPSETDAPPPAEAGASPVLDKLAAPPPQAASDEVAAAIDAWRRAWQARDADSYLAAYAPNFQPPGGLALSDWRTQRQDRLRRARDVHIVVEQLDVSVDGDSASARFRQRYSATGNQDTMRKQLLLVRTDGRWRITEEKADTAAGA